MPVRAFSLSPVAMITSSLEPIKSHPPEPDASTYLWKESALELAGLGDDLLNHHIEEVVRVCGFDNDCGVRAFP